MTDKIEKLANDEIGVIVWPYGAGQKQVGLCFDDEKDPAAIFALAEQRALLLRDAIFGTQLRAEVASLRQQLDEARTKIRTLEGFEERYWAAQKALDEILGPNEEDGAGEGFVAEIWLVAEQRDKARADRDRLLDVYRAAAAAIRAWTVWFPAGYRNDPRWAPVQRFLDAEAPDGERA